MLNEVKHLGCELRNLAQILRLRLRMTTTGRVMRVSSTFAGGEAWSETGGILKRSLGMASHVSAMPKGSAFEPATLSLRVTF